MTKRRDPLTFERSLALVAGRIGWARCGEIVGAAERTVRNWSEQDTTSKINLDAALKLDVAYLQAGGDGAPMWQCYTTRLELESRQALFSSEQLARAVAVAAKESGQAIEAAIIAARPGASDDEVARAVLEVEEAIAAKTNVLTNLHASRRRRPGGAADTESGP